ncbi:MAG: DUF169 domain-containing protein [Syntrophales bacterium]|jgi:uncharacterized protein (DUF169 family)|nr:DUF169 domain-containing protein [Syntrophales bacterium]MDY0045088.1 DUF169 domain-containing protein [Syntrophales bacterium]
MEQNRWPNLQDLLDILGLDEKPMAVYYTDNRPESDITPAQSDLPTREKEIQGQIDWEAIFKGFSCVIGHLWKARRKRATAWFSAEHYGCPGAAFFLGFNKPQNEFVIHYVATGIPGHMNGECYLNSPNTFRNILEYMNPDPAPKKYLAITPIDLMAPEEEPSLILFFCRPESMAGLHQLATFVTGDAETVKSPWGSACSSIIAWPFFYLNRGIEAAVLGGWDPTARQFYKTDELSLALTPALFEKMLLSWQASFLKQPAWKISQKKIEKSKEIWKEKTVKNKGIPVHSETGRTNLARKTIPALWRLTR